MATTREAGRKAFAFGRLARISLTNRMGKRKGDALHPLFFYLPDRILNLYFSLRLKWQPRVKRGEKRSLSGGLHAFLLPIE